MGRSFQNLAAALIVTVFALAILAISNHSLRASNSPQPSASGKLVVHEWGTFTSFAGSDGVNLEFRPLVTNDLPRFVMTPFNQPGHPHRNLLKDLFVARQRMETPVTYFYTDVPRTVNVRVDFPKGMLSEWYPVVKDFNSGHDNEKRIVTGNAYLDWGAVRLTPPTEFAAIRVQDDKGEPVPAALPPVDAKYHYGRARETDSAIVETVDADQGSHFEKFLFYRGLGNFILPLKLAALGRDRFEISNSSTTSTGALFLVRIEQDRVRYAALDPIAPQAVIEANLPTTESTVDDLAAAMVQELTAAGLYEKESLAMVNTWRDSWFGEPGTRLLYLLPDQHTDAILPLTVEPAPDEQVRILVGRLETLTPEDCQRLQTLAAQGPHDPASNAAIRTELKSLGRFAEPALQFIIGQTRDADTRTHLEALLTAVRDGGC
jgi:hypothetical protein